MRSPRFSTTCGTDGPMRIRTIKPEFWRSDDITALSREDRLLFIGLWSYVDDNGVGIDDYRQIAADLFALEEDVLEVRNFVREGLATLSRALLISKYEFSNRHYIYINTWERHQRVDRPNKPRYPRPADVDKALACGITDVEELFATLSREEHEDTATGTEEQRNRVLTTTSSTEDLFNQFWSIYPRKEQKADARKAWGQQLRKRVNPERIIAGAKGYAERCRNEGTEKKYMKLPAGWLRSDAFDDHLPPPEPVPDTRSATEIVKDLWKNADAAAVARILRIPFVDKGQPPSDTTPAKEWETKMRRAWITEHSADAIKALEELKVSA